MSCYRLFTAVILYQCGFVRKKLNSLEDGTVGGAVCANVAAKRIAELTRTYPCEVGGWL